MATSILNVCNDYIRFSQRLTHIAPEFHRFFTPYLTSQVPEIIPLLGGTGGIEIRRNIAGQPLLVLLIFS
jgi:hypothetical protein